MIRFLICMFIFFGFFVTTYGQASESNDFSTTADIAEEATDGYSTSGTSGCGLGTQLFRGDRGMAAHIMAASTNQVTGQAFSITSGTSGCEHSDKSVVRRLDREQFIKDILPVLAEDMSRGEGNYLKAYSTLLGCSTGAYEEFSKTTQKNYDAIFQTPYSSRQVLTKTKSILSKHPRLQRECSTL